MTNMKMSDEERAEYPNTALAPQPLYPYGLCIMLDDDALEKLGLKSLPNIDQVIEFKCKAQVTGVRSRKENNDEEDSCVDLQITEMEVVSKGDLSAADKLYGG